MSKFPKIVDNGRRNLLDSLIEASVDFDEISIATGYWDLEATALLLPYLKNYKKIRLLIGREPLIPRYQLNEVEPDFPDRDIFEDLQKLKIDSNLKPTVKELKLLVDNNILEVKVFKKAFLHAKCYIFGNFESENAIGIIGSSNFTRNGLTTNRELNAGEDDQRVVQFNPKNKTQEHGHLSWFEEVWTDDGCIEWTGKFIELVDTSIHGELLFSPYEMYIHSLHQIYKDELVSDIKVHEDSKDVLHAFQIRNAELILKKLFKYGVAMLADSVGLGKTVTAGAVIKKYIDNKNLKKPRIEVIVPASLKSQWQSELAKHHDIIVGIDHVYISSLQNFGELESRRKIDEFRQVDLFVIDEAHNLRNANSERYKALIDWIQDNEGCHVLLMTATPINNQLSDFATQINLASGGREDLFYVQLPKMGGRQQTIKEHYDAIIDLDREIKREVRDGKPMDTEKINKVMRPILQHFMVRSTRDGIEREFGGVIDKNGDLIKFPKAYSKEERYKFIDEASIFEKIESRDLPLEEMLSKSIESIIENKQLTKHPLDLLDQFAKNDDVNLSPVHKAFLLTTYLGLPIYRTALYKNEYFGKTIEHINELLEQKKRNREEKFELKQQMTMHNLMRILYLKRAESSVYSLKRTMEYYAHRIELFEKYLNEQHRIVKVSNLKEFADALLEDIQEKDIDERTKEISIDADETIFNLTQLRVDIDKDKKILAVIITILDELILQDDKFDYFVGMLRKFNEQGKKVLVFSYFSDTVEFLKRALTEKCSFITKNNSGFTTEKVKKEVENLANRFSPISKGYTINSGETELQFLFSTDVLSEGQNLQDCSVLVNYDLHWNPVRMIQRNGRVNRLGGIHEEVFIHNLCPADEIETYLKLEDRLKKKIEMIKSSIGTDQSILGEESNAIEFNEESSLDNDRILEITKKIYEDDVEDAIKAFEKETDILATEDIFIADLRRFDNNATDEEKNRIYNRIPLGKCGVLPVSSYLNDSPDVLTHSVITLRENDGVQSMPIFVGLPRDGRTISFVDRLDALKTIQASPETKSASIDFSDFDQEKIKNILDERLSQIAEQAIIRPENNLKPSQEKVLDLLHEMNLPAHLIERSLKEHSNRTDRNYMILRLRRLYSDIKDGKPMNQKTLSELIQKAEKVVKKLDQNAENQLIIEGDPIIYCYYAKS